MEQISYKTSCLFLLCMCVCVHVFELKYKKGTVIIKYAVGSCVISIQFIYTSLFTVVFS